MVFDEPRPGALKTVTTEDNVTKIHDFLLADHRLQVSKITETVGISKDRVVTLSHRVYELIYKTNKQENIIGIVNCYFTRLLKRNLTQSQGNQPFVRSLKTSKLGAFPCPREHRIRC